MSAQIRTDIPKNLDRTTLRELVMLAQSGNPESKRAEEALVADHDWLFKLAARRASAPGPLDPDLLQEVRIAFLLATRKWNPTRGTSFGTYAWRAIQNAASKYMAREYARLGVLDATGVIPDRPDPFDGTSDAESRLLLADLLSGLSPKDRYLLRRLYEGTVNQSHIAQRWGVSRTAVQKRLSKVARIVKASYFPHLAWVS